MIHRGVLAWFAQRRWAPFAFQREAWAAYLAGRSGLVHAATGTGKTLAVWMAALNEALLLQDAADGNGAGGAAGGAAGAGRGAKRGRGGRKAARVEEPLRVVWVTPMRALANDTVKSLEEGLEGLEASAGVRLGWVVEARTGDTSGALKARQRRKPPQALVTTPESLTVLLSYADGQEALRGVRLVVCDEWHELLGTKRGVQTELALARVRALAPGARTWGLSATLGNVEEAAAVLAGDGGEARAGAVLVSGVSEKAYAIETIVPPNMERFPWAGHLGLRLLGPVLERVDAARSTLLFTNTRSQSEIWFQAMLRARPDLIGQVAIHHGSLGRELRSRVEALTKEGKLKCVVCTSSLDLGVDFVPVDQVIQMGSPKGIGRFLQRAGRSGHQPGRASRVVCVPTNALELVEFAAAQDAVAGRRIEARRPLRLSMDVLVQHLVTLAVGGGFDAARALAEVRATHAFAELTDEQWSWALDFAVRGGPALGAYERHARLAQDGAGLYRVASQPLARLHRMGIGTIVSDAAVKVAYASGRVLGTMEEGFFGYIKPGDAFVFAGRRLEFASMRNLTAVVRPMRRKGSGKVPSWQGSRMPLSHELAEAVRGRMREADGGEYRGVEMEAARPVLEVQRRWSRLPRPGELLVEEARTPEGYHAFVYPLEGRLVHEGLAALLAWRIAAGEPRSFSMSASDYGFELLSATPMSLDEAGWRAVLRREGLAEDLLAAMNAAQLARRQFREIARIAGLLVPGYPGAPRSTRQMQASSELFFDVFSEFDPGNLLLDQARREVLERQLELRRMAEALERIAGMRIVVVKTERLTPLSFPLWVDRLREQLSTERWTDRVQRMLEALEEEAGGVMEAGGNASAGDGGAGKDRAGTNAAAATDAPGGAVLTRRRRRART